MEQAQWIAGNCNCLAVDHFWDPKGEAPSLQSISNRAWAIIITLEALNRAFNWQFKTGAFASESLQARGFCQNPLHTCERLAFVGESILDVIAYSPALQLPIERIKKYGARRMHVAFSSIKEYRIIKGILKQLDVSSLIRVKTSDQERYKYKAQKRRQAEALCDVWQAIVATVFFDHQWRLSPTFKFVYRLFWRHKRTVDRAYKAIKTRRIEWSYSPLKRELEDEIVDFLGESEAYPSASDDLKYLMNTFVKRRFKLQRVNRRTKHNGAESSVKLQRELFLITYAGVKIIDLAIALECFRTFPEAPSHELKEIRDIYRIKLARHIQDELPRFLESLKRRSKRKYLTPYERHRLFGRMVAIYAREYGLDRGFRMAHRVVSRLSETVSREYREACRRRT